MKGWEFLVSGSSPSFYSLPGGNGTVQQRQEGKNTKNVVCLSLFVCVYDIQSD